ncbi:MAG: LutB/LldF family L-lactate oxidation iron-sulfur protein [Pseudomonas sp.]
MSSQTLIPSVQLHNDFKIRAHQALADGRLQSNFRSAMDSLMSKRAAAFSDTDECERLRTLGNSIRARALSKLPDLLEQLEQNLTRNGVNLHWAETVDEANAIVLSIIRAHEARQVIKGKSMVSEEMEMNHVLAEQGIECLESDMGEFIVQLDHEKPSHIIMPAIHKNAGQVASLFHDKLGVEYTKDVDQLIQTGRRVLRQKFFEADIGVSGFNFAVAETGSLLLVENEGNGRMSTTVPPVHIAVTGIEKVVENLRDVVPLLSLLTRSALGQPITTYVNLISGPRRPHELDGPQAVHLVLLDNGRSQAFADSELRQTLNCIRCGACMNHCPVYTRIGGHAYGEVYPGPTGKIITPHLVGLQKVPDHPSASSLCGACGEVCPVKIPIPALLRRLREENVKAPNAPHPMRRGQGSKYSRLERLIWNAWRHLNNSPRLYRSFLFLATRLRSLTPGKVGPWTQNHSAPKPAARSLHELAREHLEGT